MYRLSNGTILSFLGASRKRDPSRRRPERMDSDVPHSMSQSNRLSTLKNVPGNWLGLATSVVAGFALYPQSRPHTAAVRKNRLLYGPQAVRVK